MKWIPKLKPLSVCALSIFLSTVHVTAESNLWAQDKQLTAATSSSIQALQLRGEGAATELHIVSSAPTTYTSYKSLTPARLVIDFSQAVPAESLTSLNLAQGPVKGVAVKRFDTDAGVLTRVEVFLAQDAIEPVITPVQDKLGELKVSFPGYVAPVAGKSNVTEASTTHAQVNVPTTAETSKTSEVVASSNPAATDSATLQVLLLKKITSTNGTITVTTSTAVPEYKIFTLNKPDRIVLDLPSAKYLQNEKLIQLSDAGVTTARIGTYADKVRVVFDVTHAASSNPVVEKTAAGLVIKYGSPISAATTEKSAPVKSVQQERHVVEPPKAVEQKQLQLSALDFQTIDNVARVVVKTTGVASVDQPVKSAGMVSFRIKNALLPRAYQRSLETRQFVSPVLRITPVQVKTSHSQDILVRVALKEDAAYTLRQEADVIYLDFKNTEKSAPRAAVTTTKSATTQKKGNIDTTVLDEQSTKRLEQPNEIGKKIYTGRKVTLEFADAEVRKIFQLLSEVSNKNFVLGDEVTGNISLKLVNVPWDQALDIILDTKNLDKREEGNIIIIRGKGKFKSLIDEEIENKKAALKGEPLTTEMFDVNYADLASIVSQFNALKTDRGTITQDQRTNKIIVKDVAPALADMRKILTSLDMPEKQVMIEARIVEASADFTRSLGISWGLNTSPAAGGQNWPFINSLNSVFGGLATTAGTSAIGSTPGAADITFGTIGANVKLSMRLNAAAQVGLVRIVSSPKVATLNNKSAKITQGKQIPYVSSTSDKVETKFVEAALSLEVTPHINNNGTIILKVDAKNDAPDTTSTSATPPINKKQATTEMLLKDGETTVIGGIFVDTESEGEEGVPWLMDIPILGNLFKSTTYNKGKTELLIFITPRILNNA